VILGGYVALLSPLLFGRPKNKPQKFYCCFENMLQIIIVGNFYVLGKANFVSIFEIKMPKIV